MAATLNAGLGGTEGEEEAAFGSTGNALEDEVAYYYESNEGASVGKSSNSRSNESGGYFEVEYLPSKTFEEEARECFLEQLNGCCDFKDIHSNAINLTVNDRNGVWNSVQVRVDEDLPTRSPLARYQESVSKSKDWEASLPRWERDVVDDFNEPVVSNNPKNGQLPENRTDKDFRFPSNPPPSVPIYQPPKFTRAELPTHDLRINQYQDPIKIDPQLDKQLATDSKWQAKLESLHLAKRGVGLDGITYYNDREANIYFATSSGIRRISDPAIEPIHIIEDYLIGGLEVSLVRRAACAGVRLVKTAGGLTLFSKLTSEFGLTSRRIGRPTNFASRDLLESHFIKHGREFKNIFSNPDEYLSGAQDVIKNGIKVIYYYKGQQRIGYLRFAGTTGGKTLIYDVNRAGSVKFEFVGTNNQGKITTYHIESGKSSFWRMLNNNSIKNITPFDYLEFEAETNFLYKSN